LGDQAKAEFAFMSVAVYVDPDGTGQDRDVINVCTNFGTDFPDDLIYGAR
jgi:hypothetical protein